jgi:hypothetical protein
MKFVRVAAGADKICTTVKSCNLEEVINGPLLLRMFESGLNAKTNSHLSA